ncbi:MAG: hypothetical protein JO033_11925 [Acidobacteriaceae bacterium]|nr:hypothetical protein [Acidobacteriaceae bacterium]
MLLGRVAPQWDAADFFGPEFSLVADHIKAGRLLLWDPWADAGSPDFAEPELGTTSPVLLLVGLISPNPQAGFVAYWMLIWVLAGTGFLLFTKHLSAPLWGGAVTALGFVSSGFFTGHAEHTSSLYSITLLPWILWRFDAALLRRSYWFAVQAGALYGLSALGGYPQFTILTPFFLALWAIGRSFFDKTSQRSRGNQSGPRLLVFCITIFAITSGLGAIIYGPSYIGLETSTRGFSDRVGYRSRAEATSSNILPVPALSTFSSPYLAVLNLPPHGIWPKTDVSMSSIYMGGVPLVLCCFALYRGNRWHWWLVGIAVFFAACSLGDELPVRGWLYDFALPTRFFRNASMFSVYTMVVFGVLAAFGSKELTLLERKSERKVFFVVSILLALSAATAFAWIVQNTDKVLATQPFAVAQLILIWFGIAGISIGLYRAALSNASAAKLLVIVALVDALMSFRISKPIMYTEATVFWWHTMNTDHDRRLDLGSQGLNRSFTPPQTLATYRTNQNLSLKISVLRSYVTFGNRFDDQFVSDPVLREMALGSHRIWFCTAPVWSPPDNSSFGQFSERVHMLGQPVLVLHSPEQMRSLALRTKLGAEQLNSNPKIVGSVPCSAAAITSLSYRPNWLSFDYLAPAKGWLLVTDRWATGWRLTVNAQQRPVIGGDFIFRAVRVDPGKNAIQFRYRPSGFFISLFASWATLVTVLLVEIYKALKIATEKRKRLALQPA